MMPTRGSDNRGRAGFTIMEIVITVAIMAIMTTASVLYLGTYSASSNTKKTLSEFESVVIATQKRSITQDGGYRWNVRISNTTSSGSQFMSFSGTGFATSSVDRTYTLSRRMSFSEPASGSTYDLQFAPISGMLSSRKVISIVTGRGDGFVGDLIMSLAGLTTKRVESGMVGYWHFDEATSTTAYDASGMGNSGTLTNNPTRQSGSSCVAGGCISFNGTNNLVTVGTPASMNLAGLGAFTISAWIKTNSAGGGTQGIIERHTDGTNAQGTVRLNTTNHINVLLTTSGGFSNQTSVGAVAQSTWTHVAVVYNGATISMYINGVLDSAPATTGTVTTSYVATAIGAYNGGSEYFNGLIDEVRIYNRALSATEIANQYNDLK